MRRIAKPFTVEVKRAGRVRKPGFEADDHGGDLRFRDAERMFRSGGSFADEAAVEPVAVVVEHEDLLREPDVAQPERRILPDLIAEAAAISSHERLLTPEPPRRRGRPPKNRDAMPPWPIEEHLTAGDTDDAIEPDRPTMSDAIDGSAMMLDLTASARRRASRDSAHLPRAQRWKRRLPKVCW